MLQKLLGASFRSTLPLFVVLALFMPHLGLAGGGASPGLVPCGNEVRTERIGDQICTIDECATCDLLRLAQNIINFFVLISVVVATLLFVNAGVLYLGASANPGNVSRAHKIFINTVIGLIIVLASWLVIDVIMKTLAHQSGPYSGPWDGILCNAESNMNCVPVLEGIVVDLIGEPFVSHGVGPGWSPADQTVPIDGTAPTLRDTAITKAAQNLTNNCQVYGGASCRDAIIAEAQRQGVDPAFAFALAQIESGGCANPATCRSGVGAVGVIQIMPATGRELCGAPCAGFSNEQMVAYLQDPQKNIELGVKLMQQAQTNPRIAELAGDDPVERMRQTAAFYNGGNGALAPSNDCGPTVTKWECNINPGGYVETQRYVANMLKIMGEAQPSVDRDTGLPIGA